MILNPQDCYEVESQSRVYFESGQFYEPFLQATFINLDGASPATTGIDINGFMPLPRNVAITLSCHTRGKNVTPIEIIPSSSPVEGILVIWTKYRNLTWQDQPA